MVPQKKQKTQFNLELKYNKKNKGYAEIAFKCMKTQILNRIEIKIYKKEIPYTFDNNCLVFSSHRPGKCAIIFHCSCSST